MRKLASVQIPSSLVAGDTWSWTESVPDYSAADGYTLKYALLKSGTRIVLTSTASGADHAFSIAATTTAAYAAGDYTFTAYVEKTGGIRYTVGSGTVTVKPDLAAQSSGYDGRSQARKILDTLLAAYETASSGRAFVAEYEIAGRHMKFNAKADWITEINYWKAQVEQEDRANAIAHGDVPKNKLLVRF